MLATIVAVMVLGVSTGMPLSPQSLSSIAPQSPGVPTTHTPPDTSLTVTGTGTVAVIVVGVADMTTGEATAAVLVLVVVLCRV